MSLTEVDSRIALKSTQSKQAMLEKAEHEERQARQITRRFYELIARVLQVIHIDRDGYGPLGVEEPIEQWEFKKRIQKICKEYL